MSGITFKAFLDCVGHVANVGKPIMLRSRHGVGKSSLVYQYGDNVGLPVVERRASQMTEGDLLGLPRVNEEKETTEWLVPDWFKQCCDEAVILFVDELDRATMEVRQGFFELTDSRKLAGHQLHPDTLIFAAVNGGEDASQYQVGEMDPAELDRWTVFDVSPDVQDWVDWGLASKQIAKPVLEFITDNPNHLEHKDDFEPNKVYPSRRSWHRLSQCMVEGDIMHPGETATATLVNIVTAFCGLEASIAFTEFLKNYQNEVQPDDILVDGKLKLVKGFSLTDHVALIDKMNVQECFKGTADDVAETWIQNLAKYFMAVPSEAAIKLIDSLGQNGEENCLLTRLHGVSSKVVTKMVSLYINNDEKNDK